MEGRRGQNESHPSPAAGQSDSAAQRSSVTLHQQLRGRWRRRGEARLLPQQVAARPLNAVFFSSIHAALNL